MDLISLWLNESGSNSHQITMTKGEDNDESDNTIQQDHKLRHFIYQLKGTNQTLATAIIKRLDYCR